MLIIHNIYKHFFSYFWNKLYKQELRAKRLDLVVYLAKKQKIDIIGNGWEDLSNLPWKYRVLEKPPLNSSIKGPIYKNIYVPNLSTIKQDTFGFVPEGGYYDDFQINSKIEILKKYKFNVCYENVLLKGYITDKLPHTFFTNSIPIYLGAPDIENLFSQKLLY